MYLSIIPGQKSRPSPIIGENSLLSRLWLEGTYFASSSKSFSFRMPVRWHSCRGTGGDKYSILSRLLYCSSLKSFFQVREGIVPTPTCTLVFLLLYFSSLAAALWWALTYLLFCCFVLFMSVVLSFVLIVLKNSLPRWALTTASWAIMVLCALEPKVAISNIASLIIPFGSICS